MACNPNPDALTHVPARAGVAPASTALVHTAYAIEQSGHFTPESTNRILARAARKARLPRVAERLEECGRGWWAWDDQPDAHAPILDAATNQPVALLASCNHRLCPRCAPARSRRLGRRLDPLIAAEFKAPAKFVTLTRERLAGESPAAAAAALLEAFTRLRRAKIWSGAVRGGFSAVHFSGDDGGHVHLHAVVDADWLGQDDLLAAWRQRLTKRGKLVLGATGGVNIQQAASNENVTYYALKAQEAHAVAEHHLPELLRWMHGRRWLQVFGSLRGKRISEPKAMRPCAPLGGQRGAEQRTGINAATREWVPTSRVIWQSSELAHRIGAGMSRVSHGATYRRSEELPDNAASLGGGVEVPVP